MPETVYNLFLMYQDNVCGQVRYVAHDVDLRDQNALDFLLGRVALDLNNSKVIQLTKPFAKADAYADLRPLGITAEELWELRNGLLHMTNLDSRAVGKNKVRRISFHVGSKPFYERDGIHYFSFYELLMEIGRSHVRWLESYNQDIGKRVDFVSRYDKTISDSRMAYYSFVPPPQG